MKMKAGIIALLFAMSGFVATAYAESEASISQAEMEDIKASCKDEAKDAVTPDWYEQECVNDRVQALKEEKGIAEPKEQS